MKKLLLASLATGIFLYGTYAQADNTFGTNITIADGIEIVGNSTAVGSGIGNEDNEAEPKMVQSQAWDLEGFFLKEKQLTIVGGYNFYTGNQNLLAGDIFIDTNGDALYSPNTISDPSFNYDPGYQLVLNSFFRYDYVLDIDWTNGTYDIIKLAAESILKDTVYGDDYNQPSNPWIYYSGGTNVDGGTGLFINTYEETSQDNTGFLGWGSNDDHYVASFDLGSINLSNGALFHNTMECGNDNLMGRSAPVPEPATMLLFGTGLAGLAGISRRRKKQA